ncbi:MAG TPA: hypothetical protein VGF18_01080 [Candidatus Tumulicola sp.]|jgi:hypothetical protein
MRFDIEAYVRDTVAVREPELDFGAVRARAARLPGARPGRAPETIMPALIAIVMLAFVFAGQIVLPQQSSLGSPTPAPAPARTV